MGDFSFFLFLIDLRVIFESMRTHSQIDLFAGLDEDVVTELRDRMIRMVLHTDMSTHFVALKVCVCVRMCACLCSDLYGIAH